jgi:acyl-CoA thioesterase FadM
VNFRLQPSRLGTSSLSFVGEAWGGDELRARAQITVVQMSLETRKSVPFATDLRERIAAFLPPP